MGPHIDTYRRVCTQWTLSCCSSHYRSSRCSDTHVRRHWGGPSWHSRTPRRPLPAADRHTPGVRRSRPTHEGVGGRVERNETISREINPCMDRFMDWGFYFGCCFLFRILFIWSKGWLWIRAIDSSLSWAWLAHLAAAGSSVHESRAEHVLGEQVGVGVLADSVINHWLSQTLQPIREVVCRLQGKQRKRDGKPQTWSPCWNAAHSGKYVLKKIESAN